MCSWLVWAISCLLVPVVISGSSRVDRGLFGVVLVVGRCILRYGLVLWGERGLPVAGAVPKRGEHEHCGQRQDNEAEDGLGHWRGHRLYPLECRSQTFAEGDLEPRAGGHLPAAGQVDHEQTHDGEPRRDNEID